MPTVPHPILNNLKCANCKNWLSCGPVRVLPKGGSVCGRCRYLKSAPRNEYRHFAYEALACYFKFPCKYWNSHCPKLLPFKKVIEHEESCSYGYCCCCFCCCHPFTACKSDKKLDVRAAIKLEITPDEVLEYLRCSTCAGYLSCAPVLVAKDGTSTCHRCTAQHDLINNSDFIRDTKFEAFVDMMIFPCVFRYEGCTQLYKFGEQMWKHEVECPYGTIINNTQHRRSRQQEEAIKSSEPLRGQKERGVIETLSGHIYGTITPNAPLFGKTFAQDVFIDEFQRHRENLANRWGRAIDVQPQAAQHQEQNGGNHIDPRYPDHSRNQDVDPRYPDYSRNQDVDSRYLEVPRKPLGRYSGMVNHSFTPADGLHRFGNVNSSFGPSDGVQRPVHLGRPDSAYENMGYGTGLIDELKVKQNLKKVTANGGYTNGDVVERRTSEMTNNSYYEREEPRKMAYSVYSK